MSDLERFLLAFERFEQGVTPWEGSIVLRWVRPSRDEAEKPGIYVGRQNLSLRAGPRISESRVEFDPIGSRLIEPLGH